MKDGVMIGLIVIEIAAFIALFICVYKIFSEAIKRREEWESKFVRDKPLPPLKAEDIVDIDCFNNAISSANHLASIQKINEHYGKAN